ncbi:MULTISPECIES: peptide ABC transporter substrate-binding protein [Curtobacterium]|uniref:peptide ABC transporter substrate-binding protein n=1 Tax=Curtobacterium TaxID=2034 RepID=UPI0005AC1D8F|nr:MULTISPECIES: ABC transporter substrate-binding protein [Curtobacterium]KIQ07817.1 ABC transporter substrate-binding protein [Curtobacterium flaccumfaciens]VXB61664.1 Oligopeptide transport system substrate-binding protein [Curtobacterium sp. 8I-2]
MIKKRAGLAALAVLGATAIALTGCSGSGSSGNDATKYVTANGSEPQNPLIPSNTTETGGGKIIDAMFAGLKTYKPDGTVVNDLAKSVESTDSKTYDIVLKSGQEFSNGEKITSESFTKAWDWASQLSNAQGARDFFNNIEGFNEKKDSELTGLKVKSDTEFSVTLTGPDADWPARLGYSAFVPLPSEFYKDTKAFGENPIGNGPYKFASKDAWKHNQKVDLAVNKDYDGYRKAKNNGVEFVFYTSLDTAYSDAQAGNLDILDTVPAANFKTYKSDFPDRNVNQDAAIFQGFYMPYYLDHWKGEEGKLRRAALSEAINREEITKKIFDGTRKPATDFTSPTIPGYDDSLTGDDVTKYNPSDAKKKWAEADKISPWKSSDTFTLSYNADGGHEDWVTAVANSISNSLGIKAEGKAYATFQESLAAQTDNKLTGGSRTGWQADYPSLYNFLQPNFETGAGNNYARYSSSEFDKSLADAQAQTDEKSADEGFAKSQEILLQDLPTIPLWYANEVGVWSDTVSNVQFGWNTVPAIYAVTKK